MSNLATQNYSYLTLKVRLKDRTESKKDPQQYIIKHSSLGDQCLVLFTNFPYLADEEDFEKFRKAGIAVEIKKIKRQLDFVDLPKKSGSESETHRALKKLVSDLLCELGATDVEFENNFIDVSSKTLQIAVECGDTPIGRVWSMLFNDFCSHWIKEVWCIYPENGKTEIVKFAKSQTILDYEEKIGWRATV